MPEGGRGKALMARPLREELFLCGFPKERHKNTFLAVSAKGYAPDLKIIVKISKCL